MKKVSLLIASLIIFWGFVDGVKAETLLEEIDQSGVVKFAIRNDSPPFGFRDSENNLNGLCLDFFALLKRRIIDKLNRQTITVRVFQSSINDRLTLVANKQVYLECGPNTIRSDISPQVAFSRPFFTTGIQFLVRPAKIQDFDPQGTLENFIIGVLTNTTTADFIRKKYPLAQIQEYKGASGRLRGIQALRQEKIDGFASDGILLIGETIKQGASLYQNYALLPGTPLVCEKYGMIVSNDPEWLALVNAAIEEMIGSRELSSGWFDILETYGKRVQQACEQ